MNERLISEALDKAIILRLPPEAYADMNQGMSQQANYSQQLQGMCDFSPI
jgi:hypothetical protein